MSPNILDRLISAKDMCKKENKSSDNEVDNAVMEAIGIKFIVGRFKGVPSRESRKLSIYTV